MNRRARNQLILASFMLIAGAVLPFLMIIGVVESTFLSNFLVFGVSVAGLFLGVLAVAQFVQETRPRDEDEWPDDWREL